MRLKLEELFRHVAVDTFQPSHIVVVLSEDGDTVGFTGHEIVKSWQSLAEEELLPGETPLSQGLRSLVSGHSANNFEVYIWTPSGIEHVTLAG